MHIVAYCDQRYASATRQAVGGSALLLTCPPVYGGDLIQHAADFAQAGLVYFNLHGAPGGQEWWISAGAVAVTADDLQALELRQAVIFMVNCYAGGALLDVLKQLRPRAIIGGFGENLGALDRLAGADLLGLWVRRGLGLGFSPPLALSTAKARLMAGPRTASVDDALQFEVLYVRDG
jgi:hypothetical protein